MSKLKALGNWFADTFYRHRSNAWKAAVSTSMITFVATVLGAAMTLFSSLQDWIGDGNTEALLDDLKVAYKLTLSAFVAAWTGLVNYVFRLLQSKTSLPGNGPTYGTPAPPPAPAGGIEPNFPDEFP